MGRTTYEVTGMSPQSRTFPQKLNGFSAKGLNFDRLIVKSVTDALDLLLHIVASTETHLS